MKYFILSLLAFAVWSCGAQPSYWSNVHSGTEKDLLAISFGSPATGYIGGRDSLLLKTTDGGDTWQPVALPGTVFGGSYKDICDVNFVSDQVGYITVTNYDNPLFTGMVYQTLDGGGSWAPVDAGSTAAYRSYFFSQGNGFVTGSAFFAGGIVSKISNGNPAGYHMLYGGPDYFIKAIDFRSTQQGIVGGADGKVFRTFDGGSSWDTVQTNTGGAIYGLKYLSDSLILAAVNANATMLVSRDAGTTWQVEMGSLTFDYPVMRSVAASDLDSFIAVGASTTFPGTGTIYWHNRTFNQVQHVDRPLHGVAMQTGSVAYAVGEGGLIVSNKLSVTALPEAPDLAGEVKLYPNPAAGSFTLSLPVKYTLKVFDASGRLVFCNDKPVYTQQVRLKGRAAGAYIVQLEAGGRLLHQKVILK